MHVELLHTSQYLLLQLLLTSIPRKRQRSTPPFKVVHLPPSQESRTSNKLAHLFLCIAQLQQHVAPHALLANDGQGEIHTMKRHPVDLLLPALPVPEGHRVRERAIIEVVTESEVRFVALFLRYSRKHSR